MVSKIFGLLALVAVARASPISDVGDAVVGLFAGSSNLDASQAAALLGTRLDLLSALVSSGTDADLVAAFAASSSLGPSLRARIVGLGFGSFLEKRECRPSAAGPAVPQPGVPVFDVPVQVSTRRGDSSRLSGWPGRHASFSTRQC